MIKKYKPVGEKGNCLVTIAIGEPYLNDWELHALPSWLLYAEKHQLGVFCITDHLIPTSDPLWKKPTWQKLLLGDAFKEAELQVKNICYLDTDILINPFAPNIFDSHNPKKISLVSQEKNLPFPLHYVKRVMAFNRNKYYSADYPLDSALFMTPQQIFKTMATRVFDDYACAGLILFNVQEHKKLMRSWFENYTRETVTLTMGDEPVFNAEVQSWGNINWLPYKFQALWNFEMAWKYPFLYNNEMCTPETQRACIQTSLFTNYFLHFAGSWHESMMWKDHKIVDDSWIEGSSDFMRYLDKELKAEPKGIIKPSLNDKKAEN